MVNHLRSLLLNSRRPTSNLPPWDRYMDPSFIGVQLPSYLEDVRIALIGSATEWYTKTLRAEAVYAVVSADRYEGFHLWKDPRVTSMPVSPFYIDFADSLEARNDEATNTGGTLVYISDKQPSTVYRRWGITLTTDTTAVVLRDGKSDTITFTGELIPFSDDIAISVNSKELGAEWVVTSIRKPTNWLTTVYNNLSSLSDVSRSKLFVGDNIEDELVLDMYKRWYNKSLFEEDKLAAITLSYVRKATRLMET